MTEELVNLFELSSQKGLDFKYSSSKLINNFAIFEKEKNCVYINISEIEDEEKIIKLKDKIKKIIKEIKKL